MLLGSMPAAPGMSKDTNPVCALAIPPSSTLKQQINNPQKETAFAQACDPEKFFIPISILPTVFVVGLKVRSLARRTPLPMMPREKD
jgi:hypothetical protein